MSAERRRLTLALLLSLLIHALLLSLTFGGQGLGLPGFGLPWQKQRIEAPDLRVLLVPAQVPAAQPVAAGPALSPAMPAVPPLGLTAEVSLPKAAVQAKPEPNVTTGAVPAKAPLRSEGSADVAPAPIPEPAVIAMEQPNQATWDVPPPTSVIAVAPSAPSPQTVAPAPPDAGKAVQKRAEPGVQERAVAVAKPDPAEREAQRQADQLEAARVEAARLEAERREAARLATARLEAQRQEATRQEAARAEAARLEAQRQETARQAAAQQEAQRQETVRQEAARVEAARLEAQRQEGARQAAARVEAAQLEAARQEAARAGAARLEAARLEAARLAAAQQEAARVLAEQAEEAKREARLRAIGRQLDEEAARRKAASTAARSSSTLPFSLNITRRVRLWGRSDPNVELVQYAEAWARKIQFNTPVDTVREVAKRPHTDPMVTVAIRSDGSVESMTFVLSSGVAEVDEAIRRIVQSHVLYPAFPPRLAGQYDVVEIRRTWHFDTAIRLD